MGVSQPTVVSFSRYLQDVLWPLFHSIDLEHAIAIVDAIQPAYV